MGCSLFQIKPIKYRSSMATMIFCFLSLLLSYGAIQLEASHHIYSHLQTSQPVSTQNRSNDPYRTGYHFQPLKNWINDPNGPMIYKGIYHLFYQYNPKGVVWGNIVWAHSTSTDLVNWTPHDAAIYPSEPFDKFGCWSGSTTILPDGTPAILYTGIINPQNEQVQNLAYPKDLSDPFLKEWIKVPQNPLMAPTQANQINGSSFRDPTTAWLGPDKRWRLIIGSKRDQRGLAILYRSRVGDFTRWTKAQHPLHSAANTGMWECPDFFPVSKKSRVGLDTSAMGPDVKHVLKVSLDNTRKEYYTIGTYYLGKGKDVYIPDEGSVESDSGLRYDYGKFYASKTFFDSDKNRRILWGWINESSSVNDDIKKGWSGLQAIPRTIVLDKSGKQLVQWPIVELEKLRTKKVELPSMLKGGSLREVFGVTPAQADVDATFEISDFDKAEVFDPSWTNAQNLCSKKDATVKGGLGPFGLFVLASKGMEEYTAVFYRIFKFDNNSNMNKYVVLMCSDQSRSSLNQDNDKVTYGAFVNVDPVHEKLSLRSLIDHSIVESFGGEGKACITARVYPTLAIDDKSHLYAFNYGSESVKITGSAWSLKTAHIS